jgi:hypothetical protein
VFSDLVSLANSLCSSHYNDPLCSSQLAPVTVTDSSQQPAVLNTAIIEVMPSVLLHLGSTVMR